MIKNALHIFSITALIAVAAPVFAQTAGTTGTAAGTQPISAPAVITCMQGATDVRDMAIIAAWDNYHDAAKTSLQNRLTALKAAFGQTEKKAMRVAVKAVWDQNKKETKKARETWKKAREAAWKTFDTARKACGPKAASDDQGTRGIDSQL